MNGFFYFCFYFLIDHLYADKNFIECENNKQACLYLHFQSKDFFLTSSFNKPAYKLNNTNFVILTRKPPNEFKNNKYGNPFPIFKIEIHVKKTSYDKYSFVFFFKQKQKSILTYFYSKPYDNLTIVCSKNEDNLYRNRKSFIVLRKIKSNFSELYDSYYYEFYQNQFLDFFSNKFNLQISNNAVRNFIENSNYYLNVNQPFLFNLDDYFDICKDIRMYDGMTVQEYRMNLLKDEKNLDKKKKNLAMNTLDWIYQNNLIYKIGSICSTFGDNLKKTLNCIEKQKDCSLLMKIEKRIDQLYQFHFFISGRFAYIKISLFNIEKPNVKYQIFCEKFKNETKHFILKNNNESYVNSYIKQFANTSLIYSYSSFLYCGFLIPINESFKIKDQNFIFKFDKDSVLEIETGLITDDENKTRVKNWYNQVYLDLSFESSYSNKDDFFLTTTLTIMFFLSFLCLIVACCIFKKYRKLKLKLTEIGSKYSNLSLASGIASASNISNINALSNKSVVDVNSELGVGNKFSRSLSKFNKNDSKKEISSKVSSNIKNLSKKKFDEKSLIEKKPIEKKPIEKKPIEKKSMEKKVSPKPSSIKEKVEKMRYKKNFFKK